MKISFRFVFREARGGFLVNEKGRNTWQVRASGLDLARTNQKKKFDLNFKAKAKLMNLQSMPCWISEGVESCHFETWRRKTTTGDKN
jgi:hypothetical protein